MLTTAFFDLDNTLYPAACGLMDSINERITQFVQRQLNLDLEAAQALHHSMYKQYGTTLAGLQHQYGNIDTEDYLEFVHTIELDTLQQAHEQLYHTLAALPLKRIIVTNSPLEHARRVLARLGISNLFEHVLDIRAFEFRAKPDHYAYQLALQTACSHAEECVFFEDTLANLQPAKTLGMTTVLISSHITQHAHADYIFHDIITATNTITGLAQTNYSTIPPVTSKIAPLT